ncbi:MAG: adaptor protein MecA [Lachnospiraceae bacterium]|nr:adaptor protein MecA [Lachnospiraceae bacterium]
MRLEKIDENVVSCVIEKQELIERSIDIKHISYGEQNLKKLFEEIVKKAEDEVGFKIVSPLVIEAVPYEDDSIEFILRCVENPDELDGRFSSFSPYDGMNIGKEIMESVMSIFDKVDEEIKVRSFGGQINTSERLDLKKEEDIAIIFEFDDIDKASDGCKNVLSYEYDSVFYKDEKLEKFYLVLSIKGSSEKKLLDDYNKACNTLAEYGKRTLGNNMTKAYFQEHYEIMIKEDAVKKLQLL